MPKAGGIPEKTTDFHNYLESVVPHLAKNSERLRIGEDYLVALKLHFGEKNEQNVFPENSWNDLYARRRNPLTSTSHVKKAVRAKRLLIDKLLRKIYGTSVFPMNSEDLIITGRKKMPHKRGKVPVPDRAPIAFIRRQIHTIITLRFSDPKHPSLRRNPPAFRHIIIEYFVDMGKGKEEKGFELTGKWFFHLRLSDKYAGKQI